LPTAASTKPGAVEVTSCSMSRLATESHAPKKMLFSTGQGASGVSKPDAMLRQVTFQIVLL
jgi:hypothetical protein